MNRSLRPSSGFAPAKFAQIGVGVQPSKFASSVNTQYRRGARSSSKDKEASSRVVQFRRANSGSLESRGANTRNVRPNGLDELHPEEDSVVDEGEYARFVLR